MDTVEFFGEQFRMGDRVGLMPMMRYARAAKRSQQRERNGGETDGQDEIEIYDSTLSLLEQCVHPDDWDRFEDHATRCGALLDDFLEFSGRVMAELANRPTVRSSDSSDGPRSIEPRSTVASSSPEREAGLRSIERLNEAGRPDLALVHRKRLESLPA